MGETAMPPIIQKAEIFSFLLELSKICLLFLCDFHCGGESCLAVFDFLFENETDVVPFPLATDISIPLRISLSSTDHVFTEKAIENLQHVALYSQMESFNNADLHRDFYRT
ncbi:hypothetical protein TNIN_151541 [Trichonephila inaurata madagascariensis]|uniref:Uncharacterized protein n=1 Tax=Trichonephila inaurata madagascariensis TaxID=2747483 RepID=A0A8X6XYL2_9ARAC|nr:hypothetical protein TNIN_151541 [Trichonephila inaurata madagascariensis]